MGKSGCKYGAKRNNRCPSAEQAYARKFSKGKTRSKSGSCAYGRRKTPRSGKKAQCHSKKSFDAALRKIKRKLASRKLQNAFRSRR